MKTLLLLLSLPIFINSQIIITGSGVSNKYSQDFDSVVASLPSGWLFNETGSNANTSFGSGTGSSNIGNTYFLGTTNEWSFGGLQSGSLIPTVGARFNNATGKTITDVYITYKGETWRIGAATRSDRLDFQYSTNATSLSTGTWIDFDALDYANPGHPSTSSGSQIHSSIINDSIKGLNIQNGADFYIRWSDFNASGADDAMGVDSFEIYVETKCDFITLLSTSSTGLNNECHEGFWTYIGDINGKYFGVKKNGNTFTTSLDITIGATISKTSSNGAGLEHGMFLMGRYWNAALTSGTITNPIDVRFFYNPTELTSAKTLRDASYTSLPSGTQAITNGNTAEWFKNTNSVPFDASYISNIIGNKFPSTYQKFSSPTIGLLNGETYVELTNIVSFSGGTGAFSYGPNGTSGNSLPVTWLDFYSTIKNNRNELIWNTASEINSSHFEVEYSADGIIFNRISDKILAAGNSKTVKSYSYLNNEVLPEAYYRIKQIDIEGEYSYSKIIYVKNKSVYDNEFYTAVYPTNLSIVSNVNIEIKGDNKNLNYYSLVDYTGKEIYKDKFSNSTYKLDISELSSGIYFISLVNGNNSKTYKLIK